MFHSMRAHVTQCVLKRDFKVHTPQPQLHEHVLYIVICDKGGLLTPGLAKFCDQKMTL